jgi:hypothetical protein
LTCADVILGTHNFTIDQDLLLNTVSDLLSENDSITWDSATGTANQPGYLDFVAGCTSPCLPVNGYSVIRGAMAVGATISGQFIFEDVQSTTRVDNFTTGYSFALELPGVAITKTAVWRMPVTIRCDNTLTGGRTGCVFPAYRPTLYLSEANYGAAAVNVQIGQLSLLGGPGTASSPLTRGRPDPEPG